MKIMVYVTAALLLIGIAGNFAIRPLAGQWQRLNSQIINKQQELSKNLKLLSQKDNIKVSFATLDDYTSKREPGEHELSALLSNVEKQATTSGIHILNLRPRPEKDSKLYKKYILEMNCTATMEEFIDFIYNLQQSVELIRVEKLKLVSQGKRSSALKAYLLITKIHLTK
ncbi:MAG: type 4a pilus biogenesis protein PilO [Candidatus Omnitrophica bacterium]|nr:type 4a pilus biogenesis protein PilO [Candidatus Omnitrophota bacterium]